MIEGDLVALRADESLTEPMAFGDARFAVADRASGAPVGTAALAGAEPEHRRATAVVDVADEYRADTVRTLCRFAFDAMNLAKVEAVTDDPAPWEALGFVREVHRRRARWAAGAWRDEYLLGLLREEPR